MSFAWPLCLWLLVVPAALLAWELTRRRRAVAAVTHPKIIRAEVGTHDLSLAAEPGTAGRRRLRPWLAVGLVFAIVALARPQWGRIEEPVFDQSREIILAVDLSRSMLSPDVKPSRLERAKLLIQALLERLQGERVGLVVFSGTAFLQSPLSADYEILREFLPALKPDFLPEGGTNYRALIDTTLDAFGNGNAADRFLIVLSDGEATDDDWKSRVPELKQKGIRVIGLGVGTAAGSMIPDGSGGFVKDDRGAVVLSKLESGTLQELAQATGGVYRDASTWIDLAGLINETVDAGRKGHFVEKNTVRYVERFQWPLALALWCFLVSFYYEFPVRPRPREIALRGARPATGRGAAEPAAGGGTSRPGTHLGTATAILLLLAGSLVLPPHAARAAVKVGPAAPAPATASPTPEPPATAGKTLPLAQIVGRLANADTRTPRDWAELAQETASWGSRLQSAQQPVPEGPVRDALAAVDAGSRLDAHAADWPRLKQELEALLQKPESQQKQNQPQSKQDKQDQKQDNKDDRKQDQKNDASKSPQQNSPSPDKNNSPSQPQSSPTQSSQPENGKRDAQNQNQKQDAFGNMKSPPPSQSGEMQKVGGAEKKDGAKPPADPTLALPMEKLEQLRSQDSPAQLFQMMRGDRSEGTRRKPGKDW